MLGAFLWKAPSTEEVGKVSCSRTQHTDASGVLTVDHLLINRHLTHMNNMLQHTIMRSFLSSRHWAELAMCAIGFAITEVFLTAIFVVIGSSAASKILTLISFRGR